jgi:hypothetical protein
MLITRDSELAKRAERIGVKNLCIRTKGTEEQLREIHNAFQLDLSPKMERCSLCNSKVRNATGKNGNFILEKKYVPELLKERPEELWICSSCNQIYWRGSHWKGILSLLSRIER